MNVQAGCNKIIKIEGRKIESTTLSSFSPENGCILNINIVCIDDEVRFHFFVIPGMQRLIPSKHHTTPILRTFLQHRYRTRLYFATMASSPSQPRALSGNTNADTDTDTVAAPLNQQPPLSGRRDVYDGLIIDPDTIPPTPTAFKQELASALHTWRTVDGYRGVWLKIPLSKAHHIGHAVEAGFVFHHAEPGYCMLTHWLPPTENKLPPNASHQVGVGAFCFDRATRQVLVVQEKHGPLKGLKVWKMPLGW